MLKKFPGSLSVGLVDQLGDGKFARPVNGHEERQLAFGGLNLSDIEMKEANRSAFETLSFWFVTVQIRQS